MTIYLFSKNYFTILVTLLYWYFTISIFYCIRKNFFVYFIFGEYLCLMCQPVLSQLDHCSDPIAGHPLAPDLRLFLLVVAIQVSLQLFVTSGRFVTAVNSAHVFPPEVVFLDMFVECGLGWERGVTVIGGTLV